MANSNGWGDGSVNNNIGWGQGSNNAVGWGKSHLDSWAGATDIDGGNLPSNSVAPAITGTAQEGQTLTCSTGTWSGSPTYTYQWKRNGSNIGSATNSTYTLVTADVGQSIKCTVTATNFVGSATADSNTVTPTSSTDADAQAFITAASITDPTQQSAINQLVVDLKGYNIWSKMKALYPMVGGTATTHKFNLKDPRDLDAAFRLVFSGGITHSANGVQFGGVNGYGDTKFIPSSALTLNSSHISFYSRTTSTGDSGIDDFGTYIGLNQAMRMMIKIQATTDSLVDMNSVSQRITGTVTTPSGLFLANRQNSTSLKYTRNTTSLGTNTNANTGTLPTTVMGLGCLYNNSTASFTNFSARQCAFASVGDGLSDTEAANLYTAVQAFQVTLGRSIGTQTVSDADAQAFVTNAGIVDQVEANAVNNLVIGLKADGLWTKMKAVYPMVGGTNAQHTWNLRNTAQYQISWIGGVTSSNLGVKFNGLNSYGDTGLNFSTALASANSNSLGYYSGTNLSETRPDVVPMGSFDGTNGALIAKSNTTFASRLNSTAISFSTATMRGFFSASRQSSTLTDIYLNGSQVATGNSGGVLPNFVGYLGNVNISGSPYGDGYMLNDMRFAYVSDGLNDTEMTNLYNRVQTFNTALARQV